MTSTSFTANLKSERLRYVDMARGFAILLVIAGHLLQEYQTGANTNRVMWFICSFHMPLFFAISGYIGQLTSKPINTWAGGGRFLLKKALQLLVPFFVWSVFVHGFFYRSSWIIPSLEALKELFIHPGALWFLPTLFRIFLYYFIFLLLVQYLNKNNRLWVDLSFVALSLIFIAIVPVDLIRNDLPYVIAFYLGVVIAKHDFLKSLLFNPIFFCASFILFSCTVCIWDMTSSSHLMDVLRIIIFSSAFVVVMCICKKYEDMKWGEYLSVIGRYTLEIYVIHWSLIIIVPGLFIDFNQYNGILVFIVALFLSIPIAYICICFSKIIEISPELRILLFGRKK